MSKIVVVKGPDRHTHRLIGGLTACDQEVLLLDSTDAGIPEADYYFVDYQYNKDISSKLAGKATFLYDTEDSASEFDPGIAYVTLKSKALAFCKMTYHKNDVANRFLKRIAFPLELYLQLSSLAKQPISNRTNMCPSFIGMPTFIGRYNEHVHDRKFDPKDNPCETGLGMYSDILLYNQRFQWLWDLEKEKMPWSGGIVFDSTTGSNTGLEFQRKIYGDDILNFKTNRLSFTEGLQLLAQDGIALCPTGHERNSWRVYSAMALGCVIYLTDIKDQTNLYMPKVYNTVLDSERISDALNHNIKTDTVHYLSAAKSNKEILAKLTPSIMWKDFLDQLK